MQTECSVRILPLFSPGAQMSYSLKRMTLLISFELNRSVMGHWLIYGESRGRQGYWPPENQAGLELKKLSTRTTVNMMYHVPPDSKYQFG